MKPEDGAGYFTRTLTKIFLLKEKLSRNRNDYSATLGVFDVYDDMKKAMNLGEARAEEFMSAPREANIGKLGNPARVTVNHRHGTEPWV